MKRYTVQSVVLLLGCILLVGSIFSISLFTFEREKFDSFRHANSITQDLANVVLSSLQNQNEPPKDTFVVDVQKYERTPAVPLSTRAFTISRQGQMQNIDTVPFLQAQMQAAWTQGTPTLTPLFTSSPMGTFARREAVSLPTQEAAYIALLIPELSQSTLTAIIFDLNSIAADSDTPEGLYTTLQGPFAESSFLTSPETAVMFPEALHSSAFLLLNQGFYISTYNKDSFGTRIVKYASAALIVCLIVFPCYRIVRRQQKHIDALLLRTRKADHELAKRNHRLKEEAKRYKYLTESTNVIPWSANLTKQRFEYVGPQIEDLTGYPAESWTTQGFWLHHIHPDDRMNIIRESLGSLKAGEYTTLTYRIRAANGHVLYIRNMITLGHVRKDPKTGKKGDQYAQGFILDVTEMRRAQDAVEEARRQAEEANKTKSEFLANMSHELRTPLNAIIGFSEIMREEIFGPIDPRYKEYSESIHSSGKHLLDLINDVLDLSKIEAGRIELTKEDTDILQMLNSCRTLLNERATSAGLTIEVDVDASLPRVLVDSRRIKQIIINLMSNSIKFTEPGGKLTMEGFLDAQNRMAIRVSDTGIGMSPEEIPIAMKKFGQIDGELARKHQGTGLGLSIASSLAELHGGSLDMQSEKGKGTSITIFLPSHRFRYHDEYADVKNKG